MTTETQYAWPKDVPRKYSFTGNASDEWQEFFQGAYQFAVWASQKDDDGLLPGVGCDPLTFEVSDFHDDLDADGITIRTVGPHWGGADLWAEFTFMLTGLPSGQVDGDLFFTNSPPTEGRYKNVLLHLWHD